MRMTLDLLHEFANTEVFCLFHNCMLQSQTLWSQCLFLRAVWTNRRICPLFTGLSVLIWSASTFSSASLSLSNRSTDTGTQLFTGLPVLTLVLSQPNKTPSLISWVIERDGCSLFTGLPVLTIGFLVFGWVCWESSLPPAISEPNTFLPMSLKEIFGGGRGDAHTFSYMISPVSIMIAFGIQ